jgi:hypothetical protein
MGGSMLMFLGDVDQRAIDDGVQVDCGLHYGLDIYY